MASQRKYNILERLRDVVRRLSDLTMPSSAILSRGLSSQYLTTVGSTHSPMDRGVMSGIMSYRDAVDEVRHYYQNKYSLALAAHSGYN